MSQGRGGGAGAPEGHTPDDHTREGRHRFVGRVAYAALEQLPLAALVALYAAGRAAVQAWTAHEWRMPLVGVLRETAYWLFVLLLVGMLWHSASFVGREMARRRAGRGSFARDPRDDEGGPIRRWIEHVGGRLGVVQPVAAAVTLLVTVLFLNLFIAVKTAIPALHAFRWDVTLYHADRLLDLGHDPWRLLQPLLGHPLVTRLIDDLYALWYVVMMGVLLWQCWSSRRRVRTRYLLAFVLCWAVGGSLLATVFSSAGPVYFGRVTGLPNPYRPLLHYLASVDSTHALAALEIQRYLWESYTGVATHSVQGISAMPSMHVSMAVLAALVGSRHSRWLGAALWGYAAVIFLGSIHLAWHYALDGYGAVLVTLACWWAAGRLADLWDAALRRPGGSWRERLGLAALHREQWSRD